MSNMPEMNISFTSAGTSAIVRGERGVVFLILRDGGAEGAVTVLTEGDIPSSVSAENKKYIKMALIGNETAPKSVICYFIGADDDIDDALSWAAVNKVDYLAMPTAQTDELASTIKTWVIEQKSQNNMVKAVLPNCAADSEFIVNFVTTSVRVGDDTFTAEQMTPRIAGIICGTPLEHSVTYASLPEASDCVRMTNAEMEEAAGEGKLFCFWDGEKVKLSRGINSLVTFTDAKNKQFSKIKHVEVMNNISADIKRVCQDTYIGKFGNSYSNRCLLVSAIGNYLSAYLDDGIISSFEIGFDIQAIKAAMAQAQIDYSQMSDEEIVQYDFGTEVYVLISLRLRDAIEDIKISVII